MKWILSRRGAATGVLAMLLGLTAAGCSKSGDGFDPARFLQPWPRPTSRPTPDSPAGTLRLLEWSYNNKAIAVYRELFTCNYRFYFSPLDSAGASYRATPWTCEDELISTTHLFLGGNPDWPPASIIRLTLDKNFFVTPDPNFTLWDRTGRWHAMIQTQVVLEIQTADGNAFEVSGRASFYFVRGDSACIPEELLLRGFGPDSTRWYIRRWDDETGQPAAAPVLAAEGGGSRARLRPGILAVQAIRTVTWGSIKVLYR